MEKWPIGVFASIDAGLGVQLDIAKELGVTSVQLHTPHKANRTPAKAEEFLARLKAMGITISVVFAGFEGESYADIPTCQRTVGLVPADRRAERVQELKEIADFAKLLGVNAVGLHIGFVPHDHADPAFQDVLMVTRDVCDYLKGNGQNLHLETGQETAETLLAFLEAVGRDNLFVNFDPANMILYGCGDPIEAVTQIGSRVRSVHCKDGKWSDQPGVTFGAEMPLGQGDVGMESFIRALDAIGYTGPLTIEREIPQEPERQKAEIGAGIALLEEIKKTIG